MLEEGRIPTFIAATATLVLALWVLWLGPSHRVHRALTLFLVLRGMTHLILAFDHDVTSPAGRTVVYFFIALPFAALHFAYVFASEHSRQRGIFSPRRTPWVRATILVAAIVLELLYLTDHARWISRDAAGAFREGWMTVFIPLLPITLAFLAWTTERTARRQGSGEHARALYILAFAFLIEPAFRIPFDVANALGSDGTAFAGTKMALRLLGLVAASAALFGLVRTRSIPRRFLATLLVPAGTGLAVAAMARSAQDTVQTAVMLKTLWFLDAFWLVAFVALAVYGTIMHRLFDIDLKAKRLLRGSTLAALLGVIILVAGEVVERLVPINDGVLALVAAVAIAIALKPLQSLAGRLGDSVFPGVAETKAYEYQRAKQLYTAALEGAYRDGRLTDKERAILDHLRAEVRLTSEDATRLEEEFRTAQGIPAQARRTRKPPKAGASPRGLSKAP